MSDVYKGVPAKPTTLAVRPLTKGMVRNLPTALLPDGAAYDLQGAHVYTEGLERRDGYALAFQAAEGVPVRVEFVFPDEMIQEFLSYWTSTGSKQLVCLTNRSMYIKVSDVWMPVHWVRQYTKSSLVGDTLTDSTVGRDFAADFVVAGMYVELYNTVTEENEYVEIKTVNTGSLVLVSAPSGTYAGTFYIVKRFHAEAPFVVDWTASPTRIYVTDGYVHGVDYWDGSFLHKLDIRNSAGTVSLLGARTIDFIGDRLFFGYCTDAGPEIIRNRIRWSTALNDARVEDEAYQDLADFGGEILKLKVLGQYNMCYLSDGIAYGRQSNITALPYVFTKIETGGVGLVGPRAVAGHIDMHFYVGSDDIYSISGDLGPRRLGAAINSVSVLKSNTRSRTLVRVDPKHRRVLFGFAIEQTARMDTFFAFYYETSAWSRCSKAWSAISYVFAATTPVLGDYPSTTWNGFPGKTYASFGGDVVDAETYYADYQGFTYVASKAATVDEVPSTGPSGYIISTVPIEFLYESKDFDFGEPDINKSLIRLGVRVSDVVAGRVDPIEIVAEGSTDKGSTWKSLGTLYIRSTDDEAKVNFRLTGATLRYRLSCQSEVSSFRLEEHTLRVRGRGLEGQRGDRA